MSDTAHTPGPWEATDLTGKPVNDPGVMSAKHCVATVWINDISRKQAVANAQLMAAAPDMLAALREVEGFLNDQADADDGRPNDAMRHLMEVRAAIAIAEGRTP